MPERPLNVLLVEDEPLISLTLVDMIEELGHQPIEAFSGGQAMAVFEVRRDIDLLITDIGLPDLSGHELVARVRAIHPTMPVIIASGQVLSDDEQSGAPRTICIGKPFQMAQLEDAIGRAFA